MTNSDLFSDGIQRWESRFAATPADSWAFGDQPTREVQLAVQLYHQYYGEVSAQAVDLGAGDGRNLLYLAEQGFDVLAVEAATSGVEKLKTRLAERNLSARVELADLRDYALPPEIDLLVASFIIHLLPEPYEVLRTWQNATRAGGIAVVATRGRLPQDPPHYWFPEVLELKHIFQGVGWRILHAREEENLHPEYPLFRQKVVVAQKPV